MPLIEHIRAENFEISIWESTETTEALVALLESSVLVEEFNNSIRNNQWLASRVALGVLTDSATFPVFKDEFGKPHIESDQHISISHTEKYATAIISSQLVGIDIEEITPRIKKIANRFMNASEAAFAVGTEEITLMYLIWCAKEAMFKLYGKKAVDFAEHITIKPFKLSAQGAFEVNFSKHSAQTYTASYILFDNHALVWIVGE